MLLEILKDNYRNVVLKKTTIHYPKNQPPKKSDNHSSVSNPERVPPHYIYSILW